LADGGEGLLTALGGEVRQDEVTGPLGTMVLAEWRFVPDMPGCSGPTAVIEMARASGLALAGGALHNDPLGASTVGTGELVMRAVAAGAKRVIVGCGGSASTDGGSGAAGVISSPGALKGVELIAACDVTTKFVDAAKVFAPQKGASPEQVEELASWLIRVASGYRTEFGVDVTELLGAGAAGGLAGGLAALGAEIFSGFELVAGIVALDDHLAKADAVMTGEGYLDCQSFSGKVVGGVVTHAAGRASVLCVVGEAAPDIGDAPFALVSLVARFGLTKARSDVLELIEDVVAEHLSAL
jgi:glycerate kinase